MCIPSAYAYIGYARNSNESKALYGLLVCTATIVTNIFYLDTVKLTAAGLILLDLSAAFDTLDQNWLLYRLQYEYGIVDTALQWYKSYLIGRKQTVTVKGHQSESTPLRYGVP